MSNLFPTIMLEVYKEHGAFVENEQVFPKHTFQYDMVAPGVNTSENIAVCKYISYEMPEQNQNGTFKKDENGYIVQPRQWTEYELELVTRIKARGLKTLYVGAGGGRFLFLLQSLGVDIHGIDWEDDSVSVMSLAEADGYIASGTYQKMDGHAMTFADNSFGCVVLPIDIVEQSQDIDALLLEAKRVASDFVFIGGSHDPINSEVTPTDGVNIITWENLDPESLPCTVYPHAWMTDKLNALGLTPDRLFESEYENVLGHEWFVEAIA